MNWSLSMLRWASKECYCMLPSRITLLHRKCTNSKYMYVCMYVYIYIHALEPQHAALGFKGRLLHAAIKNYTAAQEVYQQYVYVYMYT